MCAKMLLLIQKYMYHFPNRPDPCLKNGLFQPLYLFHARTLYALCFFRFELITNFYLLLFLRFHPIKNVDYISKRMTCDSDNTFELLLMKKNEKTTNWQILSLEILVQIRSYLGISDNNFYNGITFSYIQLTLIMRVERK